MADALEAHECTVLVGMHVRVDVNCWALNANQPCHTGAIDHSASGALRLP